MFHVKYNQLQDISHARRCPHRDGEVALQGRVPMMRLNDVVLNYIMTRICSAKTWRKYWLSKDHAVVKTYGEKMKY